jgi:ABC-type cobalamin/Fe3+-siderophores transport system ATPase subunit
MIEFSGVSFRSGGRTLLENFSWQMPDPGIYLLLGGNGTGKSLLGMLLSDRLRANSGQISIMGEPVHKAGRQVWLADAAMALSDDESVEEYIEYELSGSGSGGESVDTCFKQLDSIGLNIADQLLSRIPHHQFLLVQIALASSMDTALCILDGHLTFLDAQNCRKASQLMQRVAVRQEQFLLLTSARVASELPRLNGSWLLSREFPLGMQANVELEGIDTGMQRVSSSTAISVYFRDAEHSPLELTSGSSYRVLSRLEGGLNLELESSIDDCLRELASRGIEVKRIDLQQP